MRGYERDEYEDWDEYEDDGEEHEEEDDGDDGYEEEAHQPTQEELDYLAMRQKLKETIRKQMKKDMGTANSGSREKVNSSRKDNYGSFFGPSQPVIAQRVIQESKSLLENPDLAAKIYKTSHKKENRTSGSAPISSKPRANHPPSLKSGLKKKVEMLKNTRDYSFLLSEDAEVPASSKGQPSRNVSTPKSDARPAESMPRSRPVVGGRGREVSNGRDDGRREVSNGRDDGRKSMVSHSHNKPKVGLGTHASKSSTEARKHSSINNGSGPGRPLGSKPVPAKSPVPVKSSLPATGKVNRPLAKSNSSGARKPTPSPLQPVARKPAPSNLQSANSRPTSHGQPSGLRRPVQKNYQETGKPRPNIKQSLPNSKAQRSPPRHPPRATLRDERPKARRKRQLHDDDSEDAVAISMIRKMFDYNPNKFQDDDDDDINMEADFDTIMAEEKQSARIARQEDEEQQRLIEEEERRERMRLAKKRKMGR